MEGWFSIRSGPPLLKASSPTSLRGNSRVLVAAFKVLMAQPTLPPTISQALSPLQALCSPCCSLKLKYFFSEQSRTLCSNRTKGKSNSWLWLSHWESPGPGILLERELSALLQVLWGPEVKCQGHSAAELRWASACKFPSEQTGLSRANEHASTGARQKAI